MSIETSGDRITMQRANGARIAKEHYAKTAERFYLMREGKYLHQAGLHMQTGRRWAWTGTVEQARAMRLKADAAVGCVLISADDPFLSMQEGA